MPDEKPRKRARKPQQTYRHKPNAVCVTYYNQHGEVIPTDVRKALEQGMLDIASEHNLLINIATT